MSNLAKRILTTALLMGFPLVTGCGKDSPTAPVVAAPAVEYEDVNVTLIRLVAVADGEVLEGAGDFSYSATAYDGRTLEASGYQEMETGTNYILNRTRVTRVEKGSGYRIKVSFTATEWDRTVLGQTYADSRMDNLSESRQHTQGAATDGLNDGERAITLGTGDLQLRLVYSIRTTPVTQ